MLQSDTGIWIHKALWNRLESNALRLNCLPLNCNHPPQTPPRCLSCFFVLYVLTGPLNLDTCMSTPHPPSCGPAASDLLLKSILILSTPEKGWPASSFLHFFTDNLQQPPFIYGSSCPRSELFQGGRIEIGHNFRVSFHRCRKLWFYIILSLSILLYNKEGWPL